MGKKRFWSVKAGKNEKEEGENREGIGGEKKMGKGERNNVYTGG